MKKIYIILIIVSVLIISLGVGIFIIKYLNVEIEDWEESSGDELIEDMIFSDVSENYWASEYILYLTQRNIMFCDEKERFYPEQKVSYGEFVEILLRCSMGRLDFENLSDKDFIKIMEENKLLRKGEIGVSKFSEYITKSEVAVLLAKVDMKIRNNKQLMTYSQYNDLANIDEINQTLITHSIAKGYLKVNKENNFYPNKILSRAEVAEIIYLFLNK